MTNIVRYFVLFYALSVNLMLFYDFDLQPRNFMLFKNFIPSGWCETVFQRCLQSSINCGKVRFGQNIKSEASYI